MLNLVCDSAVGHSNFRRELTGVRGEGYVRVIHTFQLMYTSPGNERPDTEIVAREFIGTICLHICRLSPSLLLR